MTTFSKPLKQYEFKFVQMLFGKGLFKIMVIFLLVWLPWQQKAPIDLKWEKGLVVFSP